MIKNTKAMIKHVFVQIWFNMKNKHDKIKILWNIPNMAGKHQKKESWSRSSKSRPAKINQQEHLVTRRSLAWRQKWWALKYLYCLLLYSKRGLWSLHKPNLICLPGGIYPIDFAQWRKTKFAEKKKDSFRACWYFDL